MSHCIKFLTVYFLCDWFKIGVIFLIRKNNTIFWHEWQKQTFLFERIWLLSIIAFKPCYDFPRYSNSNNKKEIKQKLLMKEIWTIKELILTRYNSYFNCVKQVLLKLYYTDLIPNKARNIQTSFFLLYIYSVYSL